MLSFKEKSAIRLTVNRMTDAIINREDLHDAILKCDFNIPDTKNNLNEIEKLSIELVAMVSVEIARFMYAEKASVEQLDCICEGVLSKFRFIQKQSSESDDFTFDF